MLELLLTGVLAAAQAQPAGAPEPGALNPGDRVVVTDDRQSIRARIAEITSDTLVLERDGQRLRVPVASLRQIDRVGDSLANGTAIGAGLGGAASLALMAKACSNSNCADTSANLDPRLVLAGTLIGAGIGAIIDAAIDRRTPVYRAGQPATELAPQPPTSIGAANRIAIFGRAGWARLTDDEGSLGDGGSVGVGMMVPIGRRIALQAAYDRHTHRRDLESPGPPGSGVTGGFTGTEQLLTAKVLLLFRTDRRVRPYAGIGGAFLDSERVSEFPTFVLEPRGFPQPGPPEIFRHHTTGAGLGFAAGMEVRVTGRFLVLGDLTLDLAGPDALGSTRLTAGAGWRF